MHPTDRHRRRTDTGPVAGFALLATIAIAVMAGTGRVPDPWTALLTASAVLLLPHVSRTVRHHLPGLAVDRRPVPEPVGDATALLAALDWERHRTRAHGTTSGIAVLHVEAQAFAQLRARQARGLIDDVLAAVVDDVRGDDQVFRITASDREQLVVVLPDTPTLGVVTFSTRLVRLVEDRLLAGGLDVRGELRTETMSLTEDDEAVTRLERRLQVLEDAEERLRLVDPSEQPLASVS